MYYVPELKNNLLSIGQLQEKGLSIKGQRNTCTIAHHEKGVLCEIPMNGSMMFVFIATMGTYMCLQMNAENISQLWHNRLEHLTYDRGTNANLTFYFAL